MEITFFSFLGPQFNSILKYIVICVLCETCFITLSLSKYTTGLPRASALALTFFLTLILVALITAAIVITVMWFACVRKNKATMGTSPTTNHSVDNSDYNESKNPAYSTAKAENTPPSRPPRPPTKPKY